MADAGAIPAEVSGPGRFVYVNFRSLQCPQGRKPQNSVRIGGGQRIAHSQQWNPELDRESVEPAEQRDLMGDPVGRRRCAGLPDDADKRRRRGGLTLIWR